MPMSAPLENSILCAGRRGIRRRFLWKQHTPPRWQREFSPRVDDHSKGLASRATSRNRRRGEKGLRPSSRSSRLGGHLPAKGVGRSGQAKLAWPTPQAIPSRNKNRATIGAHVEIQRARIARNLETPIEFLYASPPTGPLLLKPVEVMLFFTAPTIFDHTVSRTCSASS